MKKKLETHSSIQKPKMVKGTKRRKILYLNTVPDILFASRKLCVNNF